jgi:hypothetical protein
MGKRCATSPARKADQEWQEHEHAGRWGAIVDAASGPGRQRHGPPRCAGMYPVSIADCFRRPSADNKMSFGPELGFHRRFVDGIVSIGARARGLLRFAGSGSGSLARLSRGHIRNGLVGWRGASPPNAGRDVCSLQSLVPQSDIAPHTFLHISPIYFVDGTRRLWPNIDDATFSRSRPLLTAVH